MRFGPFEIMILLAIFFLLFGAERLPKLARAAGQSKGEFHKRLQQ
jgi:TatA/E family protein of Tat protein translocase